MIAPQHDNNFPRELLAAYADGELSTAECLRVERWLEENPEARECLEAQEAMGPANAEIWGIVAPPSPTPTDWITTCTCIASQVRLTNRMRWVGWTSTCGLLVTAAMLIFLLPGPPRDGDNPESPNEHDVPFVLVSNDEEPYPMASSDEVQIISLPESAATLLVVGEHPLSDSYLLFAKMSEVQFHGVGSDPTGRFPELISEMTDDVLPMLWAPRAP